eukprot:6177513-Pleurochrysis_carterae.AAC.2
MHAGSTKARSRPDLVGCRQVRVVDSYELDLALLCKEPQRRALCTRAREHSYARACTHALAPARASRSIHVLARTHAHEHARTHECARAQLAARTHFMRTRKHKHAHTYAQTRAHASP